MKRLYAVCLILILCLSLTGCASSNQAYEKYTKTFFGTFDTVITIQGFSQSKEAFDKAARAMGMPYPGGIHLDRIAEEGGDSAFAFPRPRVGGAEYDFSFSGLKTAVINQIHNASQKGVELPVAYLLDAHYGLQGVWMAFPITYLTMLVLQTAYYRLVWRHKQIQRLI